MARLRRESEADEMQFQDRLAQARRKEQAWRRAKAARVIKRPVRIPVDFRIYSSNNTFQRTMVDEPLNDDDETQFLPEIDQEEESKEMHISPALRALMAKQV